MTKQQEILILDKAIVALGPDSYLGPWLTQVRSEVESAIRSDYFPEITLREAQERARAIVEEADAKAAKILELARQSALNRERMAENFRLSIIESMRDAIRTIERP